MADVDALVAVDRADSLAHVVHGRIHQAIVDRTLPPGARVTEAGIAQRLKVSKTPVREALVRLREIGLIESDGPRRNRVVQALPEAFAHAFEIREVLEAFTAEKAASASDPDAIKALRAAAETSLERAMSGDVDGFRAADRVFHDVIAEAAGNPRVTKAIADAVSLIQALRVRDRPHEQSVIECASAHMRIADAIERGDDEAAREEMRSHVHYVHHYMERVGADKAVASS